MRMVSLAAKARVCVLSEQVLLPVVTVQVMVVLAPFFSTTSTVLLVTLAVK